MSRPLSIGTVESIIEHANGEETLDRLKLYGGFVYVAAVIENGDGEFIADSQRWWISPRDESKEHDEEAAVCAGALVVTNIAMELREQYGIDTDQFFDQLKRDLRESAQ